MSVNNDISLRTLFYGYKCKGIPCFSYFWRKSLIVGLRGISEESFRERALTGRADTRSRGFLNSAGT